MLLLFEEFFSDYQGMLYSTLCSSSLLREGGYYSHLPFFLSFLRFMLLLLEEFFLDFHAQFYALFF